MLAIWPVTKGPPLGRGGGGYFLGGGGSVAGLVSGGGKKTRGENFGGGGVFWVGLRGGQLNQKNGLGRFFPQKKAAAICPKTL